MFWLDLYFCQSPFRAHWSLALSELSRIGQPLYSFAWERVTKERPVTTERNDAKFVFIVTGCIRFGMQNTDGLELRVAHCYYNQYDGIVLEASPT